MSSVNEAVTEEERPQGEGRQIRCPGCAKKKIAQRGPVTGHQLRFKLKGKKPFRLKVCLPCAEEDADNAVRRHAEIVTNCLRLAEGPTATAVSAIAEQYRPKVIDVFNGDAPGQNGVGSLEQARDTASSLAAAARLELTNAILPKAQAAHNDVQEKVRDDTDEDTLILLGVLEDNLALAEEKFAIGWDLVGAGDHVDMDKVAGLRRQGKFKLWSSSATGFKAVHGLATNFGDIGEGTDDTAAIAMKAVGRMFGKDAPQVVKLLTAIEAAREGAEAAPEVDASTAAHAEEGELDPEDVTEETSDADMGKKYGERSLRRLSKGRLAELALTEFDLTLDTAALSQSEMVTEIIKAQEEAKATAVA